MNESSISWLAGPDGRQGSTWNPTDGCEVCSPGCKNCYAMRIAGRFSGPGKPYEGLVTIGKDKKARWNGVARLNRNALCRPLRWRRPRSVFVDSMSDLFFDPITDNEIEEVFTVMALAPRHRFMFLTKRERRMRTWYWSKSADARLSTIKSRAWEWLGRASSGVPRLYPHENIMARQWPLPNLWAGVSVDDRRHGLPRIDELRDVPAAVRWLSIEPLLEDLGELDLRGIHWVVVGCESGPGARPCHLEWVLSIVEQCKAAGVPVFVKQMVEGASGTSNFRTRVNLKHSTGLGPEASYHGYGHGGRVIETPYIDDVRYVEFPHAA